MERKRGSFHADPLAGPSAALEQGDIVIIFPEGSRGKPEELGQIKPGVAHLAKRFPAVPVVVPVFMRNLGKSLPRGSFVLVTFCGKAAVAEPRCFSGDVKEFTHELAVAMTSGNCLTSPISNPEGYNHRLWTSTPLPRINS